MTAKLCFSIKEACEFCCIGVTSAYALIKPGEWRTKHFGKKTLIRGEDVYAWFEKLPDTEPSKARPVNRYVAAQLRPAKSNAAPTPQKSRRASAQAPARSA